MAVSDDRCKCYKIFHHFIAQRSLEMAVVLSRRTCRALWVSDVMMAFTAATSKKVFLFEDLDYTVPGEVFFSSSSRKLIRMIPFYRVMLCWGM